MKILKANKQTFKIRKETILKKTMELSVLCGIEACAIISGPNEENEFETWPKDRTQVLKMIKLHQHAVDVSKGSDQRQSKKKKIVEAKVENMKNQREKDHAFVERLSLESLQGLLQVLDEKIESVTGRIEYLKKEQIERQKLLPVFDDNMHNEPESSRLFFDPCLTKFDSFSSYEYLKEQIERKNLLPAFDGNMHNEPVFSQLLFNPCLSKFDNFSSYEYLKEQIERKNLPPMSDDNLHNEPKFAPLLFDPCLSEFDTCSTNGAPSSWFHGAEAAKNIQTSQMFPCLYNNFVPKYQEFQTQYIPNQWYKHNGGTVDSTDAPKIPYLSNWVANEEFQTPAVNRNHWYNDNMEQIPTQVLPIMQDCVVPVGEFQNQALPYQWYSSNMGYTQQFLPTYEEQCYDHPLYMMAAAADFASAN